MTFFLIYMAIGVIAGFLGGLLGVGGGAVTVPLLLWVFTLQGIDDAIITHLALATSLGAMVVTSASSTLGHAKKGVVMWDVFNFLALGVVAGSIIGVNVAVRIPGQALQIIFALFLLYISCQMIKGFAFSKIRTLPGKLPLTITGVVIGWVSMFFGIGGGSMTVPFLSWRGVKAQQAVGTSAALGLPIAVWGSVMYMWAGWGLQGTPSGTIGYIYGPAVVGIALTSAIFASLGVWAAHRLNPEHLRSIFGALLLLIAVDLLWENFAK